MALRRSEMFMLSNGEGGQGGRQQKESSNSKEQGK
jgi:hypothetical protein